jgi:stage V sporulation protein R
MSKYLIDSGQEWTFELVEEIFGHIEEVAQEFGHNTYTNQLEVISSEQMLDAYAAVGMPIMYSHWSFGEQFIKQLEAYKRGYMGLAYEIVINSDPCIAYLMEENTALMQTLVIAHASFGHNHFFKNNYLFKQWTDAEGIIDYLAFAKKYIRECEEKYGIDEVELILDAAHSLMRYGVDKYVHPAPLSAKKEEALRKERVAYEQSQRNEIWNTIPHTRIKEEIEEEEIFPKEPQENILYFIEKNAPRLKDWHREIIRIVRRVAQYFYPQMQTQLMNEGFATYSHYKIMHRLQEKGFISDGAMLEFYQSHTGVVNQPPYGSINPYALGFAMMQDIERIATEPTDEDREWFKSQDWVGNGDPWGAIMFAVENFKDESFVRQYLSPKVMRDFRMFALHDDESDPKLEVSGIHDSSGYKIVRDSMSRQYNIGYMIPDIQVSSVDIWGDRSMTLQHNMVNRRPLDTESATETLKYLSFLWGYPIKLESVDETGEVRAIFDIKEDETVLDIFLDDDSS